MSERVVWYRFEDYWVADFYCVRVALRRYPVIKTTPCGVWLDLGLGCKRWAAQQGVKRFACPTIEEAKASFIARKKRAISIYRSRLSQAEQALATMNEPIPPQEYEKCAESGDYLFPLRPVPAY